MKEYPPGYYKQKEDGSYGKKSPGLFLCIFTTAFILVMVLLSSPDTILGFIDITPVAGQLAIDPEFLRGIIMWAVIGVLIVIVVIYVSITRSKREEVVLNQGKIPGEGQGKVPGA